jgi:hypothetical protein
MIAVDQNQTIGLMQSQEQMPLMSTPVNHLPLSNIIDSNYQKKIISSSRVKKELSNQSTFILYDIV